jgi:hypothetical protein
VIEVRTVDELPRRFHQIRAESATSPLLHYQPLLKSATLSAIRKRSLSIEV